MSNLPSVGDWARVVKVCPCGCDNDSLGTVSLVLRIDGPDHRAECPVCGKVDDGYVANTTSCAADEGYPLHYLRRLPPPRILLEELEREEITA